MRTDAERIAHVRTLTANTRTCLRRTVAASLFRGNTFVGAAFNETPDGVPSCVYGGCPRGQSEVQPYADYDTPGPGFCTSGHAEARLCLALGATQCEGGTVYVSERPCTGCWKTLAAVGVARVVWPIEGGLEASSPAAELNRVLGALHHG